MVQKKLDNRIRTLIENGVKSRHRSLFVILGHKGRDQVVILHQMLSKAEVKARPSVLWCYKKELGFSTHRKKRMRLLQKKMKAGVTVDENDPFDFFISATDIRWCYYSETDRILGQTFGMLVLQDFEALTPNLLARTVETVEGGGIVVLLLSSLTSLQQLHTMAMDVHARYRTSAHQEVVCRFNERFLLSLTSCESCLIIDDKLNIIPLVNQSLEPISGVIHSSDIDPELKSMITSLEGNEPTRTLVASCKTIDQAKAVMKFIEVLNQKTLKYTVSLTAARGRGKSAALGLAIVAAVGFSYSNILVTSPSPENLKTLFEFVLKGLEAIHFQPHIDYDVIHSSNNDHNKAIIKINIFRHHRQCIQYINPDDVRQNKSPVSASAAELVVIDEAAAIPLPIVKKFLGPHLVFMASTINGYEGTGRSLSLKLLKQLRNQSSKATGQLGYESSGKILNEITLEESIRYKSGDKVEKWLNHLLCLDADLDVEGVKGAGCPDPKDCELYYINRDTLFSYHETSEAFLQRLMALYVASHYKNSPNDLQMMSDAPAHHLFALLAPMKESSKAKGKLPTVLCFIQVCLEGLIPQETVDENFTRGKRASGDLIPWTISQQFQDSKFASLAGARIIRIATNPNYQGMGYGSVAVKLLEEYYSGLFNDFSTLSEKSLKTNNNPNNERSETSALTPRKSLPPLLLKLSERRAEALNYMGVSFGLTPELFKFWKKNGYSPVYLRQTANELTGEHSCIVLKVLSRGHDEEEVSTSWLPAFTKDFQKRFVNLLSMVFSSFPASLALNVINSCNVKKEVEGNDIQGSEKAIFSSSFREMTREELEAHITLYDLKRLELYCQQLADYHMITDLLPSIARLYFTGRMDPNMNLSVVQSVILLNLGLQHKSVEQIEEEISLPSSQILGLFSRAIIKLCKYLRQIEEKALEKTISLPDPKTLIGDRSFVPLQEDLDDELEEGAEGVKLEERKQFQSLSKELAQYAIKGREDEWGKELTSKPKSLWKLKGLKRKDADEGQTGNHKKYQKKPFKKKFK